MDGGKAPGGAAASLATSACGFVTPFCQSVVHFWSHGVLVSSLGGTFLVTRSTSFVSRWYIFGHTEY
jgi:hypothetical protein